MDQDLAIQHAAPMAAGCTDIWAEKVSGTNRHELDALLTVMRKGDTLIVTRINGLTRSIGDLQHIVRTLKAKSVAKGRELQGQGLGVTEIA
ncbi:recombinase family protein [Lichenihabitans sp. Uapishka_5]|uniref:recombinase family protein n=1 Tax=Lichenihabitans sp. Uapishka_5 TaxID=3037302 RepID=UPI0029E7E1BB|nr:recombinase family protein [Lichenihabitans sp. Uapishka_5]